ncbi:MAG: (d)CMP kinase [Flavobacteriia bacterium]|jgi:cytidylate kinase
MQADKKITIAVDGYSSCGKSTLAKALAKRLGYVFIDTGAMYRGITLYCMRKQLIRNSKPDTDMIEKELPEISLTFAYNPVTESNDLLLNGENVEKQIRMPDVAANVSKIAAIKSVRHKLVDEQRKIGENGGIVMDGRDIGSVVFPEAELKLFVTATPEIRAKRRLIELREKGIEISLDEVIANLMERDLLDSTRAESPLIQTEDAILIDTSHCTREEQLDLAFHYAEDALYKAG